MLKNAEAATIVGSENFWGIFNQFVPSFTLFLKESVFNTYLFGSNAYIGPLWTMHYEYLGAIYIMLACHFLLKSRVRWIFYFINFIFYSNYWNYFVIGMLCCDLFVNIDLKQFFIRNKVIHFIFTAFGYMLFTCCNLNDADKFSRTVFAIGIIIFLLGLLNSSCAEKHHGNKFFCFGGRIAYSAYIVHWPIIETFLCWFILSFQKSTNYNFVAVVNLILTLFLILLVSIFF